MITDTQQTLDYAAAVSDWLLDLGDELVLQGKHEEALRYNQVAASVLFRQNRELASPRLEANLRSFGGQLLESNALRFDVPAPAAGKAVCLHVMNEALAFGGLIAMAIRWMKLDQSRTHCIALLSQRDRIPGELTRAVTESGGKIFLADAKASFLVRAGWLRRLAHDVATCVILHIDVDDVIAGVAFGKKGGPPVVLVNHAAHICWAGASVADLVANCRGSELETFWTQIYRNVLRCATIPIPLLPPETVEFEPTTPKLGKQQAKVAVGVPEQATLILTVGTSYKYTQFRDLDFVEVCERILKEFPEGFILAAGVIEDDRWRHASQRCGGRLRAMGTLSQAQIAVLHEAADIYIEGFPFGSTTALLEAGLRGIPVVLAPAQCPPPYATDGVALDSILQRPQFIEDYISKVVHLSRNVDDRASLGIRIRESVVSHHTGSGWRKYLQDALMGLPGEHCVYPEIAPKPTPEPIHHYWCELLGKWSGGYEGILEDSVLRAFAVGLRPKLTPRVKQACKIARRVRNRRAIPLPLLVFLCNGLLPGCPTTSARKIFQVFAFLFRGDLSARFRKQIGRLFQSADQSRAPHEQYRTNLEARDFSRRKSSALSGLKQ